MSVSETKSQQQANKRSLSRAHVLPTAREIYERLLQLEDQHKIKLGIVCNRNEDTVNMSDAEAAELHVMFMQIKLQLSQIQISMADAKLIFVLVQYIQILESLRAKLQMHARQLANENKNLRSSIYALEKRHFLIEIEKTVAQENRLYWSIMCNIVTQEFSYEQMDDNRDIWDYSDVPMGYDTFHSGAKEFDLSFQEMYGSVIKLLVEEDVDGIVNLLIQYNILTESDFEDYSFANLDEAVVLTMISKLFIICGLFDKSLKLMIFVYNTRCNLVGVNHELTIASLNNITFAHYISNNIEEACRKSFSALQSCEKIANGMPTILLGRQYIRTGYLFYKWGHIEEGFKMMQLGKITLELVQGDEAAHYYMRALAKIARLCNTESDMASALYCCYELLTYFHFITFGPIKSDNKPIFEIAFEHQNDSTKASSSVPPCTNLPVAIVNCLRELCIIYSTCQYFTACTIVEKWADKCSHLGSYVYMIQKERNTVDKILGKMFTIPIKEIPGNSAVPMFFYQIVNDADSSYTRIKTLLPPGGNFLEPVSSSTQITSLRKTLASRLSSKFSNIIKSNRKPKLK